MSLARLVQRVERVEETETDLCGLARRQRAAREALGEGFTEQPLHHDEGAAGVFAELVNLADMRVIDRGSACLAPEAFDCLRPAHRIAHQLDRNGAIEAFVVRFIHDAHPAFAKLTHDPIAADGFHPCDLTHL